MIFNVPQVATGAEDAPADVVFGAFADDTDLPVHRSFIIAQAMMTHGLDRRFAFLVLSIPGVARSTYGVIIAFGADRRARSARSSPTQPPPRCFSP